ncbi:hypothetical protein [Mangrovimonas sp. TPBH4]|uniref:hypothetical protein n=1 Tax=Mangrovimonas sp. TPBH4 TaxID=1645914 RepID=UPI0006B5137B|nr:hypothetical protein [Mangrovimonas sp. TPBH4]
MATQRFIPLSDIKRYGITPTNYFDSSSKKLFLQIPVTDRGLSAAETNISSTSLCALAIEITGATSTPTSPMVGLIEMEIDLSSVSGFPISNLRDKLIVYVFLDPNSSSAISTLKNQVASFGSNYPSPLPMPNGVKEIDGDIIIQYA